MQIKTRHETEGIVLKTYSYGDYDRVVRFFTVDFGKIAGIAKGAKNSRRRFPGTLEPWCYSRVYFSQTTPEKLVFLERCEPLDYFQPLRLDPLKMAYAARIGEMVEAFSPDRKRNDDLFHTFRNFLALLNETEPKESLLAGFEIRVLSCVGYAPVLDRCVICQRLIDDGGEFSFVAELGGVKCNRCLSTKDSLSIGLTPGTLKTLLFAATCPIEKVVRVTLSSRSLRESRLMVDSFVRHLLGRNLRTSRVLEQIGER